MAIIGYIRVSTVEQNTERQLEGVKTDRIFEDKASGADAKRPQLVACLDYLRDGDTLVVHSLDRLARSLIDLEGIIEQLGARGVTVEFKSEGLVFEPGSADPFKTLMRQILSSFAQFERSMIRQRQAEGIAKAKAKGVYKGRQKALSDAQVKEIAKRHAAGETKTALAEAFGVSRYTVIRALK